jgi:hypothetical protein
LPYIVPVFIYAGGLWFVTNKLNKRVMVLIRELAAAHAMQASLVHRLLIRGAYCEVCHEPIVEPQSVVLRLGPGGYDLFGHALCFPPMPS